MAYIETTSPAEARGAVRELYTRQQSKYGYVPNYAKVYCHRPELMALWAKLLAGVQEPVDGRRFDLITLAAALALNSSYCALAYGRALTRHLSADQVQALAAGAVPPGVTAAEAAMMRYARKVAVDASAVTAADIEELRSHGCSDAEIFDIAAIAAARAFFAKVGDALGVQPDSGFLDMAPALREHLTVGRAIDADPPERLC